MNTTHKIYNELCLKCSQKCKQPVYVKFLAYCKDYTFGVRNAKKVKPEKVR